MCPVTKLFNIKLYIGVCSLCEGIIPLSFSLSPGVEEVECVLRECLPSLCYSVCDWPSVLSEVSVANQNTQYCLLHLLYLSLTHGDRCVSQTVRLLERWGLMGLSSECVVLFLSNKNNFTLLLTKACYYKAGATNLVPVGAWSPTGTT